MLHRVARVAFCHLGSAGGDADFRLVVIKQVDAGLIVVQPGQGIAGAGEQPEGHSAIWLSDLVVAEGHIVAGRVAASRDGHHLGAQLICGHKAAGAIHKHRQHHHEVGCGRWAGAQRELGSAGAFCCRASCSDDPDKRQGRSRDALGVVIHDVHTGLAVLRRRQPVKVSAKDSSEGDRAGGFIDVVIFYGNTVGGRAGPSCDGQHGAP